MVVKTCLGTLIPDVSHILRTSVSTQVPDFVAVALVLHSCYPALDPTHSSNSALHKFHVLRFDMH